ncbi:MAG: polymer-forming cytoskeletal protein [Planctomycetota bacterium]|nr:polymer-forming cytoskeletal protein [Planctomycetota bacterium]
MHRFAPTPQSQSAPAQATLGSMARALLRGEASGPRPIRCYHCGAVHAVAAHARTMTCGSCYRGLVLDDLILRATHMGSKLLTAGLVVVQPKVRVQSPLILAGEGVEVQGTVEGVVRCYGAVLVGPGAMLRGEVFASALIVQDGGMLDAAISLAPDAAGWTKAPEPERASDRETGRTPVVAVRANLPTHELARRVAGVQPAVSAPVTAPAQAEPSARPTVPASLSWAWPR